MRRGLLTSLFFILLTPAAHAQALYTIIDLGTNGGTISAGYAVNATGQVTGQFTITGDLFAHAFRATATNKISSPSADLGTLDNTSGSFSFGQGINDSGQVAGYSSFNGNVAIHAFRTTGAGQVSGGDLGTLSGGTNSQGYAINASGQVAGFSTLNSDANFHAFRSAATGSTTLTDLSSLAGAGGNSQGHAINLSGQVVGESDVTGGASHAFRTTATGTIATGSDLDSLAGVGGNSIALAINTAGVVVGQSDPAVAGSGQRAFVYDATMTMRDLNDLISPNSGWTLTVARGINDLGQVTGEGLISGQTHGFLLTPVPEPSLVLTGAAAGLLGWRLRRWRSRGVPA